MKKAIIIIISLISLFLICTINVYADETIDKENFDETINDVLEGINEDDFIEITELLNSLFSENKSLKEWVITFITGENLFDVKSVFIYLKESFYSVFNSVVEIVCYILFVAIIYSLVNIINFKKTDNSENNAIYFICYSIVVTLFVYVVNKVLVEATQSVEKMTKTVEVSFPLLITIGEFCGGFGVGLLKPITAISSFLSVVLYKEAFIPILSTCFVCVLVSNISPTIKLNGLIKTLISLVKWVIGIITIIFTIALTSQGLVNSQYSGLSFKIFKYATGSMIPIVGNFISGGLDTLVASAIIVKNSFGLMIVVYLLFVALRSGVLILLTSFVLRFFVSLAEPILDIKFVNLTMGICEVLNVLCATVFISAFSYVLVSLTVINSTSMVV